MDPKILEKIRKEEEEAKKVYSNIEESIDEAFKDVEELNREASDNAFSTFQVKFSELLPS